MTGVIAIGGDPDDGFTPSAGTAINATIRNCTVSQPVKPGYTAICSQCGSSVSIEGGSYSTTGNVLYAVASNDGGNGSFIVKDGEFTGKITEASGSEISIIGGTFSVDPTSYVPSSGYTISQADSKWTKTAAN